MPSCRFQPLSRSTGYLQGQKPSAVPVGQVGLSSHPPASPETQFHWSVTVPHQVFLLQKFIGTFCLLLSSFQFSCHLYLFCYFSRHLGENGESVQPAVFNGKSALFIFFHYFYSLTQAFSKPQGLIRVGCTLSDTAVLESHLALSV